MQTKLMACHVSLESYIQVDAESIRSGVRVELSFGSLGQDYLCVPMQWDEHGDCWAVGNDALYNPWFFPREKTAEAVAGQIEHAGYTRGHSAYITVIDPRPAEPFREPSGSYIGLGRGGQLTQIPLTWTSTEWTLDMWTRFSGALAGVASKMPVRDQVRLGTVSQAAADAASAIAKTII